MKELTFLSCGSAAIGILDAGKSIALSEFTTSEFNYLANMIHEKLKDRGYKSDHTFNFDVIVRFSPEWKE